MSFWNDFYDNTIRTLEETRRAIESVAPETGARISNIFGTYTVNDNTLGQSQYDFRYRTFPADLGNSYVGHYMVININVPVSATGSNQQRSMYTAGQSILPNEFSKVDALRFGNAQNVGPGLPRESFSIPRYTRRIAESIAIFMPTPMMYTTTNEYQEISMTALGTAVAVGGAGFLGGLVNEGTGRALGGAVSGFTGAASTLGGVMGHPINPRVEVIFSRTTLRQFVFEFLLAPRNEVESESMKAIIDTLRFHSVPEIDQNTAGFTYVPPAEFDFTFYNKGVENTLIPRINTCVMDRVEVDYTPTGVYSTFSNGYPVLARLSLGVREVEPLHKRRILQGF